jgi:hypothetical protein
MSYKNISRKNKTKKTNKTVKKNALLRTLDKRNKKHKTQKSHSISTYSQKDYESNDGMLTTVWGPSMWHYLHTMSFNYPVKPSCVEKERYRNFVLSLKYVLPCGKCRKNLCNNFQKLPLKMSHMSSRATFSKYIYDLHELINTMLNKKSGLTYDQIKERYEHFRSRCTKPIKQVKDKRKTAKVKKGENGCTEPLYGEKSKGVLRIVPQSEKCESLEVDEKCIKFRGGDVIDKSV